MKIFGIKKQELNVGVEWLVFLLHIRDILGSNVGVETSYPD
jgi:hypothetical protein